MMVSSPECCMEDSQSKQIVAIREMLVSKNAVYEPR